MGNILGTVCLHSCIEPSCGGFIRGDLPWQPRDLTLEVLGPILVEHKVPGAASLKGIDVEIFGVGEGLLSCMYRLTLDYGPDADSAWPRTMIAKLMPPQLKTRVLGEYLSLFEAEVTYYETDMPMKTGMPGPRVYVAAYGGYGRYFLLMEDLAPAKCGDQLVGMEFEEAKMAMTAVASLHAKFLNRVGEAEETRAWPRRLNDPGYWKLVKGAYRDAAKVLTDERFESFDTDPAKVPQLKAVMALMADDCFIDAMMKDRQNNYKERTPHSQFSSTLIHGDYRSENIFFRANDGKLKIVDYQLAREDHCVMDVVYFMSTSMRVEVRRRHEADVIKLYYDEMRKRGADLPMEEILLWYQYGLVACVLMIVIGQKDADFDSSERGKLLQKANFERIEAALSDWMVCKAMEVRLEKWDDEGVTSVYTRDELKSTMPPHALKLLG